ncbi:UvrD-helicase domain-containing protein [Chlorogloea sp. CCALA 695]|uniref:UvrD-helicase domain-containing protein n=1 Tax=Chlorogloea sp. CCALA 695 TaxID=2107693 RepID=UPI0030DCBC71
MRVIVFGKENSKDLVAKFGVRWKASISTLHSAGFSLLKRELEIKDNRDIQLVSGKYRNIAQDIDLISKRGSRGQLTRDGAVGRDSEFLRLVNLMRLTNNYPTATSVKELCHHFEVEDIWEFSIVASAVAACLRIGEQKARDNRFIDFTDQIWLPVKWEIYKRQWFKPYKFVLCDEAQDLNAIQLELAIGLTGSEGRQLFVGDPRQAIFGFAGADNRSYQKILERTKATELPLSTCYRCPRSHIDLVRRQFPNIPIEAKEDASFGEIKQVEEKDLGQHLKVGDRVISRKTAPLVSQCIKLIARGIAATVKGRDIGETIKRDLEEIASMPRFRYEDFHAVASEYRTLKVLKYKEMDNEEQLIQNLNDKLEALATIYISQPQARSIADLSAYIDSLFSDDISPITLSTCHRAKGLEGDRIFILKPEDMPMSWRNQMEWQKEQEDNLLYVGLTRSKSELFIVGKPDWLPQEKTGEDSKSDTVEALPEGVIADPPDLKPNLKIELETLEYEEDVENYSDWMPELSLEDDDELTEIEIYAPVAPYVLEQPRGQVSRQNLDPLEQEDKQGYLEIEEVTFVGKAVPSLNPLSVNGLQTPLIPKTNAQKRERVIQVLMDKDWQGKSDRAIASYCNVSPPFVGKLRAELERIGTVNISSERIDSKGRKLDIANIGTKPKQQPTQESIIGSPASVIQAKLRIEGETKGDIDTIALLLQQTFDVDGESGDYPNRDGEGYRRYLTVKVTNYQSISFP